MASDRPHPLKTQFIHSYMASDRLHRLETQIAAMKVSIIRFDDAISDFSRKKLEAIRNGDTKLTRQHQSVINYYKGRADAYRGTINEMQAECEEEVKLETK